MLCYFAPVDTYCLWISNNSDKPKEIEQLMDGKYKLLHPYLFAELGTAGGITLKWKGNIGLLVCTVSWCVNEAGRGGNMISLLPVHHFSYAIKPKHLYVFLRLNET